MIRVARRIADVFDRSYFVGGTKSGYTDYGDVEAAIEAGFMPVVRRHAARAGAGKRSKSYLDIGCAFGFYVRRLSELGWDAAGVDVSEYAIGRGKQRGISNICVASARELPFADASYDFVTAIDVIEHLNLDDAAATVAETRRVLRTGGVAFFATPNVLDNRYWNVRAPDFEDPDTTHINYQSVRSLRTLFADFSRCDVSGHIPFLDQFRAFDAWKLFSTRLFDLWPARPVARRIAWKVLGRGVRYSSYLHAVAVK